MNHEQARMLFMDYLYDEMDSTERIALEAYLEEHPDLQQELKELSGTAEILSFMPVDQPKEKLVIVPSGIESEKTTAPVRRLNTSFRYLSGAAAAILIFFMGILVSNLNISTTDGSLAISFGEKAEPVQQGFSPEQVEAIITQVQADNAALVNQLINTLQDEQQDQIEQSLINFASYYNEQRTKDLELISLGFDRLEESTYNRFRQTDEVLGEIIQTVNTER